jgi:putative heme-binding domain-containing protein
MVRAETAEALSLQPAAGAPRTIPKASVKTRKASANSLMPDGLESGLSPEEFSDLISFLQTLRSGT